MQVVLVEPGLIATDFTSGVDPSLQEALKCPIYGRMMSRVAAGWTNVYRGASSPLVVARTIERALTTKRPRARYLCGHQSEYVIVNRFMPTWLWDILVRSRMT